jgi:chromate reductase
MRVLAIAGSLRRDSHNARLLRVAAEVAPSDVELELWDSLGDIPHYNADDDGDPALPAVAALREAVTAADAVLISTPEYNSSIPGVLKNALDWASRPIATNVFRGKPAAVISASTGAFGGVWAQAEVRKVLAAMGARVVETDVALARANDKWDGDGTLLDEEVRDKLAAAVSALVAEVAEPVVA